MPRLSGRSSLGFRVDGVGSAYSQSTGFQTGFKGFEFRTFRAAARVCGAYWFEFKGRGVYG